MSIDDVFTNYRIGPDNDVGRFRATMADGVQVVVAHLESLDNFRRLPGRPPIDGFGAYVDHVATWQKAQPMVVDALEQQRKAQ